ncbi:MAG: mucoidy inhibitor MuiA family protein [bacterium]
MRGPNVLVILSVLLFFVLLPLEGLHAQSVTSRIDAVTVYNSGATVTRVAQVPLGAGQQSLTFTGLPANIDQSRFQLEMLADGVNLGQIRFDVIQQRDAFDAEVNKLQQQIDAINDSMAVLDDSSQTAQMKLRFLDGIAQGYAKESWFEGARGTADISSWRSALGVLDEGSSAARKTLRDNAAQRKQLELDLAKLQNEMQTLRGKRLSSLQVDVTLAAKAATRATIKLHYFQPGAQWSPNYTSYLDSENRRLRIVQKALVKQFSDEPWNDIALTLSTSAPSGNLVAPETRSQFLDLVDPAQVSALYSPRMEKRAMADSALEEVMVTASRGVASPPPEIGSYAVSYRVPGRVNLANRTDDAQSFELAEFATTAELVTQIVPRFSSDAFLTAQFTYTDQLPLYASNMMVYVDQVYVGETYLPTTLTGAEVTLPMGQDRRVDVVVTDQGGSSGESGFIGRQKTELTDKLFEITNRRGSDTRIEVFDRYPVAANDDIEVSVPRTATVPSETDYQDKPGVIVWRQSLAGGESIQIRHQYEVSYPAAMRLNPREG